MTDYVAGFLFSEDGEQVVLVSKNRPDWQAGKLNGVGGHIEPGETIGEAMTREFEEEAGLHIEDWEPFARVEGDWGQVYFFRAFGKLCDVQQMTDEVIGIYTIDELTYEHVDRRLIPNLRFLIPLARYRHDTFEPVIFKEIT